MKDITRKEIKEGVGICQSQRVAAGASCTEIKKFYNFKTVLLPLNEFKESYLHCEGRNSSVGIAPGYWIDFLEIGSRCGARFSHSSRPTLGPTQLPVPLIPGKATGEWR